MKKMNKELVILVIAMIAALGLFLYLYQEDEIPVEKPAETGAEIGTLQDWKVSDSTANGLPLQENKDIYERDNSIYDVYISVFPTKDENGQMLDLSAFELHQARDHTYNPTLNCNIQIVEEDEKIDPLANLDSANATIRVRGNSARGEEYKSYKVKIRDDADAFHGQTSLNINKHCEDESKVTTKFCTDILQDVENIPSFRTNFMRVWIRDASVPEAEQKFEYYGLFTHTEQPNKQYLKIRGLSPNCVLYKARDFFFQKDSSFVDVMDPSYNAEEFEAHLGIREGENHEKLLRLLDVVNDETTDIMEIMDTYFNEDNYLDWLSFNILVGAADILNHNYLLYSPNNSETWYFLCWDFDADLCSDGDTHMPESLRGGQKLNQVSLHRRYFRVPGNLQKLQARMEQMLQNQFSPENIGTITEGYLPVLNKTMTLQPDLGLLDMTPAQLPGYIQSFPEIIRENYNKFLKAFDYPAPMFVSAPVRNSDGTVHLSWANAFSYQGRAITYNVQIATDCHMKNVIFEKKGIIDTAYDAELQLDPGTYYLKVTAVDSAGNEQISLEHYELAGQFFIYESGVLEFVLE